METVIKALGEAFESIQHKLFGTPAPVAASGADGWDAACQPLTADEFGNSATAAAINQLINLFPTGAALYDPTRIRVARTNVVGASAGRTSRDLSGGKDYLIELNRWRDPDQPVIRTAFEATAVLIHELAHVRDADLHGFLPFETAALVSEQEFVILAWQYEFSAFVLQLDGARAIYHSDKPRYRPCWDISVLFDAVLAALEAGDDATARRMIRDSYPVAKLRADYANAAPNPPTPALSAAVNTFISAGLLDSPARWGLTP